MLTFFVAFVFLSVLGLLARRTILRLYAWLTYYRYKEQISGLSLPSDTAIPDGAIQEKARASLTSVSAFLAFAVAVLVGLVALTKFTDRLEHLPEGPALWVVVGCACLGILLPYSVIWSERYISGAAVEGKDRRPRYVLLVLCYLASLFLFLLLPSVWPSSESVLKDAFPLSGFVMVLLSVFFLLSSLEFYDFASSWRGRTELHFHLASLASNSYIFGVSLLLLGLGLSLCVLNFSVGRLLSSVALVVPVLITEIERYLWDLNLQKGQRK